MYYVPMMEEEAEILRRGDQGRFVRGGCLVANSLPKHFGQILPFRFAFIIIIDVREFLEVEKNVIVC